METRQPPLTYKHSYEEKAIYRFRQRLCYLLLEKHHNKAKCLKLATRLLRANAIHRHRRKQTRDLILLIWPPHKGLLVEPGGLVRNRFPACQVSEGCRRDMPRSPELRNAVLSFMVQLGVTLHNWRKEIAAI